MGEKSFDSRTKQCVSTEPNPVAADHRRNEGGK